jgi:hypothetical protein
MTRKHWLSLLCIVASLPAACRTTTGGYFEDRLNDTIDMVPFSVAVGPGFYVGARATAIAGVGIGYDNTHRAGWKHRIANASDPQNLKGFKSWDETEAGVLIGWVRTADPGPLSAATAARPSPRNGPPQATGAGNVLFLAPAQCDGHVENWTLGLTDVGSALDAEVSIHLGIVGFRIGASPLQVLDWLVGWTTLDVLNDDLNARFYRTVAKPKTGKAEKEEKSEKKAKKAADDGDGKKAKKKKSVETDTE